jgi:hypothetical protein
MKLCNVKIITKSVSCTMVLDHNTMQCEISSYIHKDTQFYISVLYKHASFIVPTQNNQDTHTQNNKGT